MSLNISLADFCSLYNLSNPSFAVRIIPLKPFRVSLKADSSSFLFSASFFSLSSLA